MVFNCLIFFSNDLRPIGNRSLLASGTATEVGNLDIRGRTSLSCGGGYGIYLCRAHAFDADGARFNGVRWVTIAWGTSMGLWPLGSLVAVQSGYLGGIYLRSVLEHVGIGVPDVRPRRHF